MSNNARQEQKKKFVEGKTREQKFACEKTFQNMQESEKGKV